MRIFSVRIFSYALETLNIPNGLAFLFRSLQRSLGDFVGEVNLLCHKYSPFMAL